MLSSHLSFSKCFPQIFTILAFTVSSHILAFGLCVAIYYHLTISESQIFFVQVFWYYFCFNAFPINFLTIPYLTLKSWLEKTSLTNLTSIFVIFIFEVPFLNLINYFCNLCMILLVKIFNFNFLFFIILAMLTIFLF